MNEAVATAQTGHRRGDGVNRAPMLGWRAGKDLATKPDGTGNLIDLLLVTDLEFPALPPDVPDALVDELRKRVRVEILGRESPTAPTGPVPDR